MGQGRGTWPRQGMGQSGGPHAELCRWPRRYVHQKWAMIARSTMWVCIPPRPSDAQVMTGDGCQIRCPSAAICNHKLNHTHTPNSATNTTNDKHTKNRALGTAGATQTSLLSIGALIAPAELVCPSFLSFFFVCPFPVHSFGSAVRGVVTLLRFCGPGGGLCRGGSRSFKPLF